jgi:hypothetical protein
MRRLLRDAGGAPAEADPLVACRHRIQQRLRSPPPTYGLHRGNNTMVRLTPPKHVTFFISIAVAIIAVIIHYARIDIPHVHSGFVILLIGYLVLLAGNVLDGV